MAPRSKGALAKAQAKFLKAMRSFEKTVADLVGASEEPKGKKRTKKRGVKGRRGRKSAVVD